MSRRILKSLIKKPLVYITSIISSTKYESLSTNSFDYQKQQNVYFKSKILVLIALIFLGSNLLLSSLIFNVNNYNEFVQITENLDFYLNLNKKLFQSKQFLKNFKIPSTTKEVFINHNIVNNDFNQNISTSAYLNYLINVYTDNEDPQRYLETHKIDFHWGDWVDLAPANPFAKSYDEILSKMNNNETEMYLFMRKVCYDKLYDVRDPWLDEETYKQKLYITEHLKSIGLCSAIFKYYYATIPEKVVFETDFKYFEIPVNQKRKRNPFGLEGLSKIYYNSDYVSKSQIKKFNPNKREVTVDELKKVYIDRGYQPEDLNLKPTLKQPNEDFKQSDVPALIKEYEAITSPNAAETKYLKFLKFSNAEVDNANNFYFTFPYIQADSTAELHHYNFPWIKQVISHEERIQVIHHLIRSWFKFAEHAHVISWFNYGNLIGWYFNAQNLPWDNDVDLQCSIKDVDRIGRYHNNSLVVENPKNGDNLFWLQTNPFYMQQNPQQFIDARYIDVKTGLYIDISALWESNSPRPEHIKLKEGEIAFHCKHHNWFLYSDIFPLRRTIYEGAQSYMPHNIEGILNGFYGPQAMAQRNVYHHNWQKDIGIWVPNDICEKEAVPKTEDRFDQDGQLTLFGACNNTELLHEWRAARAAYKNHLKEHEALKAGEDTAQFSEKDFPIFRVFNHEDYR